jgi:hypothetical protein
MDADLQRTSATAKKHGVYREQELAIIKPLTGWSREVQAQKDS